MNLQKMSICKSNVLIEASYKLTLSEQRILLLSLGKLNPKKKGLEAQTVNISASELSDIFNIDIKDARKSLKKASDDLFERIIYLTDNNNKMKARWLENCSQFLNEFDEMKLTYTNSIMPYLSQLKGKYTTYKLDGVSDLKSSYSVRMYELLKQFKYCGVKETSIIELKKQLGIEGKYKDWRDFKRYVLTVFVNELTDKSDLKNIKYETIKTGQKITHLKFTFTPEAKKKKPLGDSHKQTEMELKKRKSALKNRKVIT